MLRSQIVSNCFSSKIMVFKVNGPNFAKPFCSGHGQFSALWPDSALDTSMFITVISFVQIMQNFSFIADGNV